MRNDVTKAAQCIALKAFLSISAIMAFDAWGETTPIAHLSFDDYGNDGLNVLKAEVGDDAVVRTTPANVVSGLGEVTCVTDADVLSGLPAGDGAVAIPLGSHLALPIPRVLTMTAGHPYSILMKVKFPSFGDYCVLLNMPGSNDSDSMVFLENTSDPTMAFKLTSKASGHRTCNTTTGFTANKWETILLAFASDRVRVVLNGKEIMDKELALSSTYANCQSAGGYFVLSGDYDSDDRLLYWADVKVYDGVVADSTGPSFAYRDMA